MPTYPHIEQYRKDLERIIAFGGSTNELTIKPAFRKCLAAYCHDHRERLMLVDELPVQGGLRPDGTVRDKRMMDRGYWEAKDAHDDLDAEIQEKFNKGYPRNNIVFEDSKTAVLVQNSNEAMRVDMTRPEELHRLIKRFLDYELPEVEGFRKAEERFRDDLPGVLESLRATIEEAEAENAEYQLAAKSFLELCHQSIGPDVSAADVREMLLQHILTKDIFFSIFSERQFHNENNIAQQLDHLEQTFFFGDVKRQALDKVTPYYDAVSANALRISDYSEKQSFLKAIYEDFYKAYNPAAADRLGVVYTPNEVVDFIIRGADYLLGKHFGRSLADENVQILDPATGTGTFITNLIEYLPADRLERKYLNEMHANEVAILPYYIANLNIEYTYREKTGRYLEFPNLVFVDTLDNMDWQGATGGAVQRQGAFELGGMSTENWMRVNLQNEKTISVILGNPPYNAHQANFNEFNPNRSYPAIDQRIRETYSQASTAQNRNQQYDMYKRFIRWASDRLADDGMIAFITNRAYIDTRQDDGFRKIAKQEFSDIYLMDLGSDVRRNPRISGTTHNVFGIQTGVAIGFLVRDKLKLGECSIHYARREDAEIAVDKLAYLGKADLDDIEFEHITPDKRNNWLNQSNSDFERLLPLIDRHTMRADTLDEEKAVFKLYSNGLKTHKDEWVYDFDGRNLASKVSFFANTYEHRRKRLAGRDFDDSELGTEIKWDSDLRRHLSRNIPIHYSQLHIVQAHYRPFTVKYLYFLRELNTRQYQMPNIFPNGKSEQNRIICFKGPAATHFIPLASNKVVDVKYTDAGNGPTFCLPLYRYTDDGERVSNITDWGLRRINAHYRREFGDDFEEVVGGPAITAEDVFAYTYAVLHDPAYREEYKVDLLREFPRLPLYHDWTAWVKMGRELLDLHIGFEDAKPYPLERVNKPVKKTSAPSPVNSSVIPAQAGIQGHGDGGDAPKPMLRANAKDKERGEIHIDSETVLRGVPPDAWRYMLGNRSALEWVLDQYKEKKPRDPTIRERFNTYRFADYKEQVIDLLRRVCTVSVRTMDVVDDMAIWEDDGSLLVFGDRDKFEMAMVSMSQWFARPEDEEWLAEWNALPDISEEK